MNLASVIIFKGCVDGRNIQNPKVSRKLTKSKMRIDKMLVYQLFYRMYKIKSSKNE